MNDELIATAIVLVAGNSSRYGSRKNKNFEKIGKTEVVMFSLLAFDNNDYINNIIIGVKKEEIKSLKRIIKKYNIKKRIIFVEGGKTRSESAYNCIKKADSDIIIIHDGVRPFIKQKYINDCIENIRTFDAATIGVKSKDTIKYADSTGVVINTIDRNNSWLIQTPQCFWKEKILHVYGSYPKIELDANITDECMLMEKDNYKVKIIEGDYSNIKITTPEDIMLAKLFYKLENKL